MDYGLVYGYEKDDLRQLYIKEFIDTLKYDQSIKQFPDGLFYSDFLWTCLKGNYYNNDNKRYKYECSMEQAFSFLKTKENVFVMWDVFSYENKRFDQVNTNNLPKDSIIIIDAKELCSAIKRDWEVFEYSSDNIEFLFDIYIFDVSMNWSVILTHESRDHIEDTELKENESARVCFLIK